MVLNHYENGSRYDVGAKFIKECTDGPNKGKYQVELNTVKVHFPKENIMDYEEYFKLYNSDKSKLPSAATGKLNFLEGQ